MLERVRGGLAVVTLAMGFAGCFSGEGTLGAICRDGLDCGDSQACDNEVCGRCGDAIPQPGELCLVDAVAPPGAPRIAPGELLAVDVELDGRADLLTRDAEGRPQWWRGDGLGAWERWTTLDVGGRRGALRAVALDEDEAVDLVVVDDDAPALHLGYGDGAGAWSFEAPVALTMAPSDVAVAGAPWSGPAWVAWVDAQGLQQAVIERGTRTLAAPVTLAPARAQHLGGPAPLDADEAIDLVVVDVDGLALEPWFGDGAGGLAPGRSVPLEARATDVVMSDIDDDGAPDVLVPDQDGGVTVIRSDGEGGLDVVTRVMGPAAVRGVTTADLNRDGRRDVVMLVDGPAPVWGFLARGQRYPDGVVLPAAGPVGAMLALDGDRDGLVELWLGPVADAAALRVMEVEP